MPRIWNRSRDKQRIPTDAVYVGRPTKWGNPWSDKPSSIDTVTVVGSKIEAVAKFVEWIMSDTPYTKQLRRDARQELVGKDLICWCAPDDCHAEIWLEIANGPLEWDDEIPF